MATRAADILIRIRDTASAGFKRIVAEASRMRASLGKQGAGISRDFEGFGSKMQGSLTGAIIKAQIFIELLKKAAQAFTSFAQAGVGGVAQMEQMSVVMATTTRDLGKARIMLAEAEKFAAETPFEIPEVVQATVRLETYGFKAREVLRLVGDMAAVMGKPLMQAVEAMADAQTGELERLKEFGITKRQLIEAGLQVNARGQIQDMQSLTDALMKIMEQRFGGGMKLMTQTFTGIVSNLKDAWGTLQRKLAEPTFQVVKDALKDLLDFVNRLTSDKGFQGLIDQIGQFTAKTIRFFVHLPEMFGLLGESISEFIKSFGKWDFLTQSFARGMQFILDLFSQTMKGMSEIVISIAKVIWNPLLASFGLLGTAIVNTADLIWTAIWESFKGTTMEEFEKTVGIELMDRMNARLDKFGEQWEKSWEETGRVAKEEGVKIEIAFLQYLNSIKDSAQKNIAPIFKDALPPELMGRIQAMIKLLTTPIKKVELSLELPPIPAAEIQREIRKARKEDLKSFKRFQDSKADAERNFSEEMIRLTMGRQAVEIIQLRALRAKYLEFGFNREQVERFYQLRLKEIREQEVEDFSQITNEINSIIMTDTEFRLAEVKRQGLAYLQQGADQVEVERWASLQRLKIHQEAEQQIRQENFFTIQRLTYNWGTFLRFAIRGFNILRGKSLETWQQMLADIIEWGTGLVAQYLISKGLEELRRAEEAKTFAQFMRHHAKEMSMLGAKLLLTGDVIRAGIAFAAVGVAGVEAIKAEKEAAAMRKAATASVALGLAVQTGGVIASEALAQWGMRAQDARQKQEELSRVVKDETRELHLRNLELTKGVEAREVVELETKKARQIRLGIDQELVERVHQLELKRIEDEVEERERRELERQIREEKRRVRQVSAPAPEPIAAAPSARGNVQFVQNNEFNGLVNFDNPEALRELARKLQPYTDEFNQTFSLATA